MSVASSGSNEVMEDPPRAVVTPRQDQPQASTSGPVVTSVSSTPTTTLKRPREATLAESDSMSSNTEDRAGPSGYQKKARTISSTEFLQVSIGGADVVEMSGAGVETSDPMLTSSSSRDVDQQVGTSSQLASSAGVATSSQKPQQMIQLGLGSRVELRKLPTVMQVPTSKLAEEDDDEWSRPYNVIDLTDESCDDSDDINADIFYQIIDWDKSLTEAISSSSTKRKIEEEIDKDNTKKRNKNHEI